MQITKYANIYTSISVDLVPKKTHLRKDSRILAEILVVHRRSDMIGYDSI